MKTKNQPLRIELATDDDGVTAYVYRGGSVTSCACGVAYHRGKGPQETVRRAIRDASRDLRGVPRCPDCREPSVGGYDPYCSKCWTERAINA